uniref:NADH-ubiquinone oxidoreductase chain 6 n=1 Tax=Pleurocladia lacustris TaxID=246121 RepID=A0A1I9LW88_9PHAE|nr:NADH dehydrogenase subunit 6 [Pleurocladia lacustris]
MVNPIIFILISILAIGLGLKVTSTQNPVYGGLYLVLLFFLGSIIAFLLGLEFIALLFLLVYAGAIAVLVLFVVMMLDVKAIETPRSSKKKRIVFFLVFVSLIFISFNEEFQNLIKLFLTNCVGSLVLFSNYDYKESIESFYVSNKLWFIEFDSFSALNDLSYLLYSTYAILLIIAGIILLIAMVGAISLTLQNSCPESLYRQLGRESTNAVFSIKEKSSFQRVDLEISS